MYKTDWAFILFSIVIVSFFITLFAFAVKIDIDSKEFRQTCINAGGVPLIDNGRYCVKANSFIEVK